jgi:hypothetical protein
MQTRDLLRPLAAPFAAMPDRLPPSRLNMGSWMARSLAASALLILLSGPACNVVAPASYALFGPGKVAAEHTLAQSRTVVFVDDRQNVLPRTALRAMIGEKVSQDLMTLELIPGAVRPADAIAATRQQEDGTKPMSIAAIGRELECQQVIYVQITRFAIAGDGTDRNGVGARPTAAASIKVIDVVNNVRAYPTGDSNAGRELVAKLREVDRDAVSTVAKRRTVEDRLAMELGDQIGKLFYEHERVELGENLGPRSK